MWSLLTTALAGPCVDSVTVDAYRVDLDLVASIHAQTWTLRYNEADCSGGLELPAELVGAAPKGDARVADDAGWKLQDVALVEALQASSGAIGSTLAVAAKTQVRFKFGRGVPLQVYTDDYAHQHRKDNDLLVWWDPSAQRAPDLIWTTWNDWATAGQALARPVESWIPSTDDLGSLGRSLKGAELTSIVSRLDATVDLPVEPSVPMGWEQGRAAKDLVTTGRATPSERGLILLAMLRGAGFKAVPAWFSPTDDPDVPRTLPAPHLLQYPAIAVRTGKETIYLDPGVRGARPPVVPARMMGGRVLAAGKHIVIPNDTAAPRGQVRIDAKLVVDPVGKVAVEARVTPSGSAEQAMRAAFTGLDAQQWPGVVNEWITPRGELRDLVVGVNGLDGLDAFTVDVRYTEPQRLVETDGALVGPLLDPLAPGLAKRLPPGIAIAERLEVVPPEAMFALTAAVPAVKRVPQLVLNRSLAQEGGSLTLSSDWHVLQSGADKAVDAQASAAQVLLFPLAKGPAKRAVKKIELPEAEKYVVETLLLYRFDLLKPAAAKLKKLHKTVAVDAIAALLTRYAAAGDQRPWEELVAQVATDAERISVIRGLEAIGDRRLGWQLATALTQSEDPATRTQAFVEVARLQGPSAPDGQADPDGHRAWRDPIKLLEYAHKQAGASQGITRLPLTLAYVRGGRPMDSGELLDDRDDTPASRAAEAEFGALTGVFGVDVLGLIDSALRDAPYDAEVRRSAGRAQAALGLRRQGVANVLLAAEIAGNDHTMWLSAADFAAQMGDLQAALYGARRASDLVPRLVEPALKLQYYGRLAGDEQAVRTGIERLKQEMHVNLVGDLANLIEQEPSVELALLRHHADVVERDKKLLLRRAQLHFERAMFEDAAQDGSLLLDEHNDATGARYLLAGISSRFWHADPELALGRHSGSSTAREARMEIQIVAGERVLATGPRAGTWGLVRRSPKKLASEAPTWPVGMKDFEAPAPAGYAPNADLSAVTGVLGWSSAALQRSILRTERATGDLPPPIKNLYSNGPTVLSTDRGASVVRLDGGGIPIYAGITLADGQDVIGLGLTPASARDAVLAGIGQLEVPL